MRTSLYAFASASIYYMYTCGRAKIKICDNWLYAPSKYRRGSPMYIYFNHHFSAPYIGESILLSIWMRLMLLLTFGLAIIRFFFLMNSCAVFWTTSLHFREIFLLYKLILISALFHNYSIRFVIPRSIYSLGMSLTYLTWVCVCGATKSFAHTQWHYSWLYKVVMGNNEGLYSYFLFAKKNKLDSTL